jgi:hypothetical protein
MPSTEVTLIRSGKQLVDISGAAGLVRYRTEQESARMTAIEKLPRKLAADTLATHRMREDIQRALQEQKGTLFVFAVLTSDTRRIVVADFVERTAKEKAMELPLFAKVFDTLAKAAVPGPESGRFTTQLEDYGYAVLKSDVRMEARGSIIVTPQHVFPGTITFADGEGEAEPYYQQAAKVYDALAGERPTDVITLWTRSGFGRENQPVAETVFRPRADTPIAVKRPARLMFAAAGVGSLLGLAYFLLNTASQQSSPARGARPFSLKNTLSDYNFPFPDLLGRSKQETPARPPAPRGRIAATMRAAAPAPVEAQIAPPEVQTPEAGPAVPALPSTAPAATQVPAQDPAKRAAAMQALGMGAGGDDQKRKAALGALTGQP